jgi:hypothetical protein
MPQGRVANRTQTATKLGTTLQQSSVKTTTICFSFSFKTCFTLSEFRLTQAVEVIYEIKELTKKIRRVTFGNNQNTVNDFREFINVTDVSKNYCVDKVAYLVEGNGDIVTPIKVVAFSRPKLVDCRVCVSVPSQLHPPRRRHRFSNFEQDFGEDLRSYVPEKLRQRRRLQK